MFPFLTLINTPDLILKYIEHWTYMTMNYKKKKKKNQKNKRHLNVYGLLHNVKVIDLISLSVGIIQQALCEMKLMSSELNLIRGHVRTAEKEVKEK